jgi:hypothetical protein
MDAFTPGARAAPSAAYPMALSHPSQREGSLPATGAPRGDHERTDTRSLELAGPAGEARLEGAARAAAKGTPAPKALPAVPLGPLLAALLWRATEPPAEGPAPSAEAAEAQAHAARRAVKHLMRAAASEEVGAGPLVDHQLGAGERADPADAAVGVP